MLKLNVPLNTIVLMERYDTEEETQQDLLDLLKK